MTGILLVDIYSDCKKSKLYATKSQVVTVVADHGNVLIVEIVPSDGFTVNKTDITIIN